MNREQLQEYLSSYPISLHLFQELASTNQTAWEILSESTAPYSLIIAERQSKGRGQWGREWQSPPGGLYLSLAFQAGLANCQIYPLVFATATGIAEKLRSRSIPVELKWPNDLILKGKKLGGIKIESRDSYIVIGVGINWVNPVPPQGINLMGYISSLEELAAFATLGILEGYEYYLREGIEKVLRVYTDLWINSEQYVTFNGCRGVIIGVTESGYLRVRLQSENASSVVTCPPGSVSLGYDRGRD